MNTLVVRQNMGMFVFPVLLDLLILIVAFFTPGLFRYVFVGVAVAFAVFIFLQLRPVLKNFSLVLTPDVVKVVDVFGKVVRKVDWKKIEGAAAGRKKFLFVYIYTIYFRVRKDDDINFLVNSADDDLFQKLRNFIRVFVRRNVPFQVVKE